MRLRLRSKSGGTTRRGFCELASLGLVAHAIGCGDDGSSADGGEASSTGGAETGGTTTSTSIADGSASSSSEASTDGGASESTSEGTSAAATDGGSSTDGTDTSGTDTGAVACEPSPGNIEGPFYRPGMPVRSDLDIYGDSGTPVLLSGRVVDGDCQPVADAVVEIWHAFPAPPDTMAGDVDITYDDTREYRYYGQVATDADGNYAFETLKPGWYLNGNQYRPAHIHVKIWTGMQERLTTQLYFEDDPFADIDPWWDATMVLVLDENGAVVFDFAI